MCQLSWNLGASHSWNPQGLSRPVMGLLCLYLTYLVNHTQLPADFKALLPCTQFTHTQYIRSAYPRNLGKIKTREGILQFSIVFRNGVFIVSGKKFNGKFNYYVVILTILMKWNYFVPNWHNCRVQLKRDGTRWLTGGEVKGKLANGVCNQYNSHYLETWCVHSWCAHLGCQ